MSSDQNGMKLEINHRQRNEKKLTTGRLYNRLPKQINKKKVNEEIKREIKKHLETNDHEITTIQIMWDVAKAMLQGKFIVIQAFFKEEKSEIDNLTHYLTQLEKEQQQKPSQQKEEKS